MTESLRPAQSKTCERATWILLAGFALLFLCHLEKASLWYADEYRGAERAREFLVTGDFWTVQENFQPNFHKPPLHYWLSASTLRVFGEGKFAMRFWTWVFAVGTLAFTAFYARLLAPDLPLAPPLALSAVALYGPFVEYVQIGLLDAGLMFWTLAVLVASELAQRNRRWYLLAGLCAGLGSLYKVPLPLGVWIVWLVLRAIRDLEMRRVMVRSRCLWAGLAIGISLTVVWPIIQIAQHGSGWWDIYIRSEGGFLIHKQSKKAKLGQATYLVWILSKWWLFGLVSLAGIVWAWWKGRSRANGNPRAIRLYELAAIAGVYFVVISLLRAKSHRYELPILPLLAIAGVVLFLHWPIAAKWRAAWIAIGVLPLIVTFWPHYYKRDRYDFTKRIPAAQRFGALNHPADFIFIIDGIEEPSFLLFFGKLRQPVYDLPAALAAQIGGSQHGLISLCDWPEFERDAPGVRKIAEDSRMVEFVRD